LYDTAEKIGGHLNGIATGLPGLANGGITGTTVRSRSTTDKEKQAEPSGAESKAHDGGRRAQLRRDKIVIATGSYWNTDGTIAFRHNPIPGVDAINRCRSADSGKQVFAGNKPIGSGSPCSTTYVFMATSLAERLAMAGHEVTIVSGVHLAAYTHFTLEYSNIMRRNHELKFKEYVEHYCTLVEPGLCKLSASGAMVQGQLPRQRRLTPH